MSKIEAKTFQSIRLVSDKDASKNQGSVVTNGGIYANKNIECEQNIIADKLIIKNIAKIAGDTSIGGKLLCPDLYTINDDVIAFRRNLIPAKPKYPTSDDDKTTIGTHKEPWGMSYIENINANHIETSTINIGTNSIGLPSFEMQTGNININENFNIINPDTNVIMMKSSNGTLETYVPNYIQWNSFCGIQITYQPNILLQITASHIFININLHSEILLTLDGNDVPPSTKIKIFFLEKNQSRGIQYKISLLRYDKKYVFTSKVSAKKLKLFFMDECVYLIN